MNKIIKRKPIKNKEIKVLGLNQNLDEMKGTPMMLKCIVTNDGGGKTLSITDGFKIFTIPFEPLEKYLK